MCSDVDPRGESVETSSNTGPTSLATPLRLPNGQVLPNRIMKSALSEGLATPGLLPGERLTRLYEQWSDGGYGLIVTGNVMVDRRHLGEPGNVVLENGTDLEGFRRWAKTGQDGGSPVWVQLNHPGRQANPMASASRPVAPSAKGLAIAGLPAPRALSDKEIHEIVDRFAAAAARADEAGFDGVQLHAAHGYLISQFLSPISNERTDRWGGSIDGRMRFLREVLQAVRNAVRPGFAVGIKLNSADFQRGGFTEGESQIVVGAVVEHNVDLIEISGGTYESPAMMGRPQAESTRRREAYFLDYAETVRETARAVPLAVTGGFRTRTAMLDAVEQGICDVVGIGRPATIAPSAAGSVLDGTTETLPTRELKLPLPRRLAMSPVARSLEGALDLQWHTDQLHRMGDGRAPDPGRSVARTLFVAVRRNGIDAIRGRRRG
jgi:2,4-dienoyl-CoA reductase-like NADH-dependent reductase (Old Yellow Enzyme family)